MVGTSPKPPAHKTTPKASANKTTSFAKSTPDIATKPSPRLKAHSSRGIDDSNSAEIEQNVHVAAKKFEILQSNIQKLVELLKAQHLSIKQLDEDRLKTAKQLELLVAEGPLAPIIASSKTNLGGEASADTRDLSDNDSDDEMTMATYKSAVSQVKRTYLELHKNQYDLVLNQAKEFDSGVVQYAEEWLDVISARVSANMNEFKDQCEKLEHYAKKVEKLQTKGKASPKLERNELKLTGVRESHDTMGENLHKLMEEVTVRAWKDLLPLLIKSIQLDLHQASEERRVIWNDLQVVLEALEVIAVQYDVTTDGRLKRVKKEHIDTLYTGSHSSHRTQVKKTVSTPSKPMEIKTPATMKDDNTEFGVEQRLEAKEAD